MADIENPPGGEAPAAAGGEAPAAPASLRDDLDAAFEQVATDEGKPPAGQPRDPAGRWASKTPAEGASGPQAAPAPPAQGVTSPAPRPGQEAAPAEPAAPELRAPAQWKPGAREKWAGVDAEVKAEVNRREREFQAHLQQSAGLRDFVQQFEGIVRPYEMFIRAENSNPLAAVQNLFQTAAQFRVGTPEAKAAMLADLCAQHAVDLRMLDGALARKFGVIAGANGAPAPQGQMMPQTFHDPRVDQILMQQQMYAQQAAEAQQNEIMAGTVEFAGNHEFFEDVRHDMADMVEMAARRGVILPLQQAYDKACAMNPEVSKILSSRSQAQSTQGMTRAALRARQAAASVKGDSSPIGSANTPDTLRGAIEAAFESSGSGRL